MKTKQVTPATIDEYIAGFPSDVGAILEKIRQTVRAAAPGAEEAIKYQMPTFVLMGNLVLFAAFKKHIGFFSTSLDMGNGAIKDELAVYAGPKGSLKFPLDKPIPYALIKKIVKIRIAENRARAAASA